MESLSPERIRAHRWMEALVLVGWVVIGIPVGMSVWVGTVISYAAACEGGCWDPGAAGMAAALSASLLGHVALFVGYTRWRRAAARPLSVLEAAGTVVLWVIITPFTVVLAAFFVPSLFYAVFQ